MNNKTASKIGFVLVCIAPVGYYMYRENFYSFLKGSFNKELIPIKEDKVKQQPKLNKEEVYTHEDTLKYENSRKK